jgi:hypothetical protein
MDEKGDCVGVYADGELYFHQLPENLTQTWNYVKFHEDMDIQYADIYAQGKTLEECCPEQLKSKLASVNKKMRAFINSFINSKVSLKENCFYDLVPARFLKEYCEVKNQITDHVLKTYQKPKEYDFYADMNRFISDISSNQIAIDKSVLVDRLYDPQAKKAFDKINAGHTRIKYNLFGSTTGRLTVTENSFPILTLGKKFRDCIQPTNNWLVEFDLNAAELRMAQALLNADQKDGDLHDWSAKNIFDGALTRTEAKEAATKWLYNSSAKLSSDQLEKLNNFYKKDALLSMYYVDGAVHTPFGRSIPCDEYHAISYLCQSSLIDLFHRQLLKLKKEMVGMKSFIKFMVHDCVVIDLADEDKVKLPSIIKSVSETKYGPFPVNVKIGSDYGNMKKVKIKV